MGDILNNIKEVYFEKYCKTCKHKKNEEFDYPCDECLTQGFNQNSHKPVKWEEQ